MSGAMTRSNASSSEVGVQSLSASRVSAPFAPIPSRMARKNSSFEAKW